MKTKNLEKLFDQFLVENNCFDEFMFEFLYSNTDTYGYFIKDNDPYHWVDAAFLWRGSFNGNTFWFKTHCKWIRYLKENL